MRTTLPDNLDKYGATHLSRHLFRVKMTHELYQLVTGTSWIQASKHFDPSGQQYGQDVETAYQAVEDAITHAIKGTISGQNLAHLTALAWLSARLGQAGSVLTPKLLEAMARLGDGEQALRRVAMIPHPVRQAEAYVWIGLGLFETNYLEKAQQVWNLAHELLNATPSDPFDEHLEVKARLAYTLARTGQRASALLLLQELETNLSTEIERAGGVTSTAQRAIAEAWAAVGEPQRAIQAALSQRSAEDRLSAVCLAAEAHFSVYRTLEPVFLEAALELRPHAKGAARQKLAELLALNGRVGQGLETVDEHAESVNLSWIYRAGAAFAHARGIELQAKEFPRKAIEQTTSISDAGERLRLCANLILGRQRDDLGTLLLELRPVLDRDFDSHIQSLDLETLGVCALTFLIVEDRERAQQAIQTALQVDLPVDDWDETYALIAFARRFGRTRDVARLKEVLSHARGRDDSWQQAEVIVAVAEAAQLIGDQGLLREVSDGLLEITSDEEQIAEHPNVLGALAIWHYQRSRDPGHLEVGKMIQKALDYLKNDDDNADAMAYLALTLAQNGLSVWSRLALTYTIQSFRQENDPNIVARAVGTATQAAALLEASQDVIQSLQTLSESVEDEWLKAEALFWIAGWQAVLGEEESSQEVFLRAMEFGAWEPVDPAEVEAAWNDPDQARQLFLASQSIGWPSTKVAQIFAALAILLSEPKAWHLEFGLEAVDEIPEEYSEKRALCMDLLVKATQALNDQPVGIIGLFVKALRRSKRRHPGEVWAVLRSCLPQLLTRLDDRPAPQIWDELRLVQRMLG